MQTENENYKRTQSLLGDPAFLNNMNEWFQWYHDKLTYTRIEGKLLEEITVKSVSFTQPNYTVDYTPGGHQAGADYVITDDKNNMTYISQKSGQKVGRAVNISGSRLQTNFLGNFDSNAKKAINELNVKNEKETIFSVFIKKPTKAESLILPTSIDYTFWVIDPKVLHIPEQDKWNPVMKKKKPDEISKYAVTNDFGVKITINPSLSWQLWYYVPFQEIVEPNILYTINCKLKK